MCVFLCYKTKRWTLSCLKALLGVSGALSHVMLFVPLSTTNIHTIMHSLCTHVYLLYQHIPHKPVDAATFLTHIHTHTHKFTAPRHTLRHHYYSAFTAYYLRPITAQQSFVLPLLCRPSYLTERKQIRHSTNG